MPSFAYDLIGRAEELRLQLQGSQGSQGHSQLTANVTSDADTVTFTYNDKPVGEPNPHFYEDGGVVIPFADVSHVETNNMLGLIVVTKHSRWDQETGGYANSAWVDRAK